MAFEARREIARRSDQRLRRADDRRHANSCADDDSNGGCAPVTTGRGPRQDPPDLREGFLRRDVGNRRGEIVVRRYVHGLPRTNDARLDVDGAEQAGAVGRPDQRPARSGAGASSAIVTPPGLRAIRSAPTITAAVWLPRSRARRASTWCRELAHAIAGTSASRMRRGQTPACSTRFIALERAHGIAGVLTHKSLTDRRRRPPADRGSKRSHVSTNATASPRAAAAASMWHMTDVRPDDRGPTISDRCSAREPAAERVVDRGDPCRRHVARRAAHGADGVKRDVELACAKQRFTVRGPAIIIFAFSSPTRT
jgi:hypothetical protein